MQKYITTRAYCVSVIGLVDENRHTFIQETNRINSPVGKTYILTMHMIYGDKFNSRIFTYKENTMKEMMNTFLGN